MLQAEDIFNKNLFQTEAHTHVLANKFGCKIIVISRAPSHTKQYAGTLFEPGYAPQRNIPRARVRQLQLAESVVFLYLDHPPKHYSACVPSLEPAASDEVREARQSTKVAREQIEIDD